MNFNLRMSVRSIGKDHQSDKIMFESFNSKTKELCAMNRYLKTNINICRKESESCAEYPEQSTSSFNNGYNITIDSGSISSQD